MERTILAGEGAREKASKLNFEGNKYFNEGSLTEALKCYIKALNIFFEAETLINIGDTLQLKGEWEKAFNAYIYALQQSAKQGDIINKLADILQRADLPLLATFLYKQAIRLNPDACNAWYDLGCALLKIGEKVESIKIFQKILVAFPKSEEAIKSAQILFLLAVEEKQSCLANEAFAFLKNEESSHPELQLIIKQFKEELAKISK